MQDGHSRQELPFAVALWQELQGYLKTETDFGTPEQGRAYEAVKVRIKVSNTAPDDPNWPRVVFTGVGLSVADLSGKDQRLRWTQEMKVDSPAPQSPGEPELRSNFVQVAGKAFPDLTPNEREFGHALFPGESITFELSVPTAVMPYVRFNVEGTLSRRHLFHHERELAPPTEVTRPPVVTSLIAFNEIRLHEPLDSVLSAMQSLGPETRLVELQALKDAISKEVQQVAVTTATLNAVYHKAPNPAMRVHMKLAGRYLSDVRTALTRMQQAVSSSNLGDMAAASEDIQVLKGRARVLNGATEELLRLYDVSDGEAKYTYRAW